ncbi:hypothetical protein [Streptomyces gardneri]|uniref:Uncharacterized protein n=1 Tax=Streptomyces gardneri TaxID=66892 RepID=A0A4Y3RN27_9ACTN|nr:hypothetical protein [Streptomyces gardneri]GEB57230.1 hypothetical protein SGA01_28350 [Streptomyces gardneri]GHH13510.1 hypothetical protein GCM10017674_60880 [Streptomyces gardneri]
MVISEDLLWDAADKGTLTVPRLLRTAVTAGCAALFVLALWANSDATWAACAGAAYVLAEIAYRVWDRRRLVEVRIVVDSAKLRLRPYGERVLFGRPGRPLEVTTWRRTCPRARIREIDAWRGMPGVPD